MEKERAPVIQEKIEKLINLIWVHYMSVICILFFIYTDKKLCLFINAIILLGGFIKISRKNKS